MSDLLRRPPLPWSGLLFDLYPGSSQLLDRRFHEPGVDRFLGEGFLRVLLDQRHQLGRNAQGPFRYFVSRLLRLDRAGRCLSLSGGRTALVDDRQLRRVEAGSGLRLGYALAQCHNTTYIGSFSGQHATETPPDCYQYGGITPPLWRQPARRRLGRAVRSPPPLSCSASAFQPRLAPRLPTS